MNKGLLINKRMEKFNERKHKILELVDNYNNLGDINEITISDLDSFLYELDFHISQFQELSNELN